MLALRTIHTTPTFIRNNLDISGSSSIDIIPLFSPLRSNLGVTEPTTATITTSDIILPIRTNGILIRNNLDVVVTSGSGGGSPTYSTKSLTYIKPTTTTLTGSAGIYDTDASGSAALMNVGTNDYYIRCDFVASTVTGAQFIWWRGNDGNYYGTQYIVLYSNGLYFGTYDAGGSSSSSVACGTISAGVNYSLTVKRTSGTLLVSLDGATVYTGANPDNFTFSGGVFVYGQVYGSSYGQYRFTGVINYFEYSKIWV